MQEFTLRLVTPRGEKFNGDAVSVTVRSATGDVSVRARHLDFFTVVDIGKVIIRLPDDTVKNGVCTSGFLSVRDGTVTLVVDAFEFSEEIDVARALDAKERAECILQSSMDDAELSRAQIKLKRALNRLKYSSSKSQ